jgi:hypothetical protein
MKCAQILLLAILAAVSAYGQGTGLTGNVTDPSGSAVPGASITVRNEGTNIVRQTTSSDTGDYTVPGLEPGLYSVRVTKPGFETLERGGVRLFVATMARVDLQLTVGNQVQAVTVTADTEILQEDNAQLSTSVTREQYDNLPLVQMGRIRSPTAFVYLAPGVHGNLNATGSENLAATNYVSVNGGQMKATEFYLNGLSAGQMANVGSYNESAPPVDAVREFKMITTMVPADYGHTGAAAGIFAVRNGTNAVHGSVYEYFRNDALDAKPWGSTLSPVTRQNEFGATIGGPIKKDRTFFFFSYGGSRKRGYDTQVFQQIPTLAERNGDFSASGQRIYDPASTRLNAAGTGYIRDQFPGNVIPASRLDPQARAFASLYPEPNMAGTRNWRALIGETLLDPDVYTTRVDHNITDNQHLYGTWVQTRIPRFKPEGSGLPDPLSTVFNQFLRATTTRLNHDWTLSPNKMNALALGYYRIFAQTQPNSSNAFVLPGQMNPTIPNITFTNGYASVATDNGQKTAEHQYLIGDTFYLSEGAHSMRIGGEFRRVHFNMLQPLPGTSSIALSNRETADPGNFGTTGNAFASMMLGVVSSGSLTASSSSEIRYSYGGLFFQDDWKVTPRLTLNLGLRWEAESIPTEQRNQSSIVSLTTPNPAAGNLPGALIFAGDGPGRSGRRALADMKYGSVAPRIGVSYRLSDKLVVRGGFGIFYQDLGWNMSTAIDKYGFTSAASYTSPDSGVTPAFTLASGFPGSPSLQPSLSPSLLNGQSADYLASDVGLMPYMRQWSLNLQYSPSPSWMMEMAYVGNQGRRQLNPQMENINQLDPKYLSLGTLLNVSATSAAAQQAGITLPYSGFTGTVAQALRSYPQYMTLSSVSGKHGYNNYNALQFIVQKRFSTGLRFSGNYTFAKNLGINSPSWMNGTADNVLQNAFNPDAEYSLVPIDVKHALVMNYTYELPFGPGKKFLSHGFASVLAGGWSVSGIHRYQSGFPLPIRTSNSLPIFNRILRPDVVPGVDRSMPREGFTPGVSRVVNPAAFATPAPGTFGNAAPTYDDIRTFPVYSEDFSVSKETQITERIHWTVGVNFFNAFNRHRFTSFNTTFSDAAFGQSSAVSAPRYIQLSTRFQF